MVLGNWTQDLWFAKWVHHLSTSSVPVWEIQFQTKEFLKGLVWSDLWTVFGQLRTLRSAPRVLAFFPRSKPQLPVLCLVPLTQTAPHGHVQWWGWWHWHLWGQHWEKRIKTPWCWEAAAGGLGPLPPQKRGEGMSSLQEQKSKVWEVSSVQQRRDWIRGYICDCEEVPHYLIIIALNLWFSLHDAIANNPCVRGGNFYNLEKREEKESQLYWELGSVFLTRIRQRQQNAIGWLTNNWDIVLSVLEVKGNLVSDESLLHKWWLLAVSLQGGWLGLWLPPSWPWLLLIPLYWGSGHNMYILGCTLKL